MDLPVQRRDLLRLFTSGLMLVPGLQVLAQPESGVLTKRIPSSGEALPVIGLGTWIAFNAFSRKWTSEPRIRDLVSSTGLFSCR